MKYKKPNPECKNCHGHNVNVLKRRAEACPKCWPVGELKNISVKGKLTNAKKNIKEKEDTGLMEEDSDTFLNLPDVKKDETEGKVDNENA